MQLNRKSILDKTHYGLKIYAFVLRQFYPTQTVLTLRGRDCGVTRNPFNDNKKTLMINIHDNLATHTDTDLTNFKGDVFDFAQSYFKAKNEADLLKEINDNLYLNLTLETEKSSSWLEEPDDTWYVNCSFFKAPVRNVFPLKSLKLHEIHSLIIGDDYKEITTQLRSITDSSEKRKYKANQFDYVTFSGVFKRRNDKELVEHSSLITIDFDHLPNINKVKEQLLNDTYFDTEMLFVSPSGDGLKWIVRISLSKATHQVYFKAISNYIKKTYNIEVDQSGKDVSRACFLAHDPTAYIHPRHRKL